MASESTNRTGGLVGPMGPPKAVHIPPPDIKSSIIEALANPNIRHIFGYTIGFSLHYATCKGGEAVAWSDQLVQAVWNKGRVVPANDPLIWRQDDCGAWIHRRAYGERNNEYGWEFDHITPTGDDGLSNLRPLQWENNVVKSDGRLVCAVRSDGTHNRRVA